MCVEEDDKIKLYVQGTRIQNEDGGGRVGIPYIVHTYICRWGVYEYVEGDDRSMGNSNVDEVYMSMQKVMIGVRVNHMWMSCI